MRRRVSDQYIRFRGDSRESAFETEPLSRGERAQSVGASEVVKTDRGESDLVESLGCLADLPPIPQ